MTTKRPTDQDIAQRAYHLWEAEGRPEGRAVAHWHQAELDVTEPVIEPIEGGPVEDGLPESESDAGGTVPLAEAPSGADPIAEPKPKAKRARKPKAAEGEPEPVAPKAPRRKKSPASDA